MTAPDPRTELSNQLAAALNNHELQPDIKREITITFRVSYAEKKKLEQWSTGMLQSDCIRARLFNYKLPQPKLIIPETNRQVIYELKKIGNNLNQQTRAINEALKIGSQPLTHEVEEYLASIKELTTIIEQTHQSLTKPRLLEE
jgi:Bacterial mobilisation protein (MobC)